MATNLGTEVTIARNCRFPELELLVSNLGPSGCHCWELLVPKGWNSWLPTWEPEVGTAGSQRLELMVPNLGTRGYHIARNCRCPEVGTHASQLGNHRLPLQETPGSRGLKLTGSQPEKPYMYQCKELLIPKGENS